MGTGCRLDRMSLFRDGFFSTSNQGPFLCSCFEVLSGDFFMLNCTVLCFGCAWCISLSGASPLLSLSKKVLTLSQLILHELYF